MIYGVGVDIMNMDRIRPLVNNPNDPFFLKTYTAAERSAAWESLDPLRYLSERFAAKEAVFKALGISPEGVRFNEIEVISDEIGRPRVHLYGALREHAKRKEFSEILLSLSHEPPNVIAFAVCQTYKVSIQLNYK